MDQAGVAPHAGEATVAVSFKEPNLAGPVATARGPEHAILTCKQESRSRPKGSFGHHGDDPASPHRPGV